MDISETQVLLKGVAKIFEAGLKSKISWTSAIPGTIHARYNGIYYTVIRIGAEQPNLPVDTTTGQMLSKH